MSNKTACKYFPSANLYLIFASNHLSLQVLYSKYITFLNKFKPEKKKKKKYTATLRLNLGNLSLYMIRTPLNKRGGPHILQFLDFSEEVSCNPKNNLQVVTYGMILLSECFGHSNVVGGSWEL